jgi:hypothetical protein
MSINIYGRVILHYIIPGNILGIPGNILGVPRNILGVPGNILRTPYIEFVANGHFDVI